MPTPEIDSARGVTDYSILTYAWVIALSMWGGVVSFVQKVRAGKVRPFNVVELVGELVVSAFVGILTFWICESAALPELASAACVGISSHMGTRGLFRLEQWMSRRLGLATEDEANRTQAGDVK